MNPSSSHPTTNGGRMLKRGDTSDIECWRTTHRLRVGQGILRSLGIAPEWSHSDCTRVSFGRVVHACDYRCVCTWPEWVTGDVFDLAYRLANETQTERGAFERNAAYTAKRNPTVAETMAGMA